MSFRNEAHLFSIEGKTENRPLSCEDQHAAGNMTADKAWAAYQKGQLQNRQTINLGDMRVSKGNIKIMESVLGRPQDGIWSNEDKIAAGGLSAYSAFEEYKKGKLQFRKPK